MSGRGRGRGVVVLLSGVGLAACGSGAPPTNMRPAILFAPVESSTVYLMGLDGQMLHEWKTGYAPGYSVYLRQDGTLVHTASLPERTFMSQGSGGGRIELLRWDGSVQWQFDYSTEEFQQHHDVFPMHNGHVLLVAWERRTAAEALAAGRRPDTLPQTGELWVDKIIEVDPTSDAIVWEWRVWDHLVPPGGAAADYPHLIDPNYNATPQVDWTHANAVFYNADLDQVMLSVRNFSEVWVVDHATSTQEARGHTGGRQGRGGDLVYRWGNPRAYGLTDVAQQIFAQHSAQWIAQGLSGAGHLLIFDNGDATLRPYSNVVEVDTGVGADGTYAYDPTAGFAQGAAVVRYDPPERFFARIMSGAQRLISGNTLVTDGPAGRFFEITPGGETVWSYQVMDTSGGTGHLVFRATRYEADYAGLSGHALDPQGPIRLEPPAAGAASQAY